MKRTRQGPCWLRWRWEFTSIGCGVSLSRSIPQEPVRHVHMTHGIHHLHVHVHVHVHMSMRNMDKDMDMFM